VHPIGWKKILQENSEKTDNIACQSNQKGLLKIQFKGVG